MSELHDLEFLRNRIHGYSHKTVLITGANGFFGSWLTDAFYGKCNLVLANRDNLYDALKGEYDCIFHFAPAPIEPIMECAKNGATVLYASSGAVYGGAQRKVSESDVAAPRTDYGIEKLRNELVLKNSNIDYRVARLFTFCGTRMKDQFAITTFVDALKAGSPLPVYNKGKTVRTYLYIIDAIIWLCEIVLRGHGIYNIGSERETTIMELAEQVCSFRIPKGEIYCNPKELIEPAPYYVPDCSKAHELGLYQWHNLEYGLRRMLE
jgi:nucleoside-diphosphate-sugar epimerase